MSYTRDTYYRDIHKSMLDMTTHLYKVLNNGREPSEDEKQVINNILIEWSRLNELMSRSTTYNESREEQERRFKELSIKY